MFTSDKFLQITAGVNPLRSGAQGANKKPRRERGLYRMNSKAGFSELRERQHALKHSEPIIIQIFSPISLKAGKLNKCSVHVFPYPQLWDIAPPTWGQFNSSHSPTFDQNES